MVKRRSSKKKNSRKGKGIPPQLRLWFAHVKSCGAKYPNKSYKQILQICKKTFTKKTGSKKRKKSKRSKLTKRR